MSFLNSLLRIMHDVYLDKIAKLSKSTHKITEKGRGIPIGLPT